MNTEEKAKQYPRAKELIAPSGFINTEPFKLADLIGKKVVLLDIWTYSCINCQRTLPYLSAWHEKYKDQGLAIVSVHSPEFEFEKVEENVRAAVEQSNIKYPVVLDNEYGTWDAYQNRYWPRKYLIDIDGFVVYDHIGEGAYEETERKIQELLKERAATLKIDMKISTDITRPGAVEAVAAALPLTPELYFGASRNERLGNGPRRAIGAQQFGPPPSLATDTYYLLGNWDIQSQFARAQQLAGIIVKYRSGKVFLVAGSTEPVTLRITRDGKPLSEERGRDVSTDSTVTIKDNRLYRLVEDPSGYGEHTLEIEIEKPGLEVYTLTFG